jgi:hypothetical protein
MIDLNKIEAAAKSATPGPWVMFARTNAYIDIEAPNQPGYAKKQVASTSLLNHQANADHIATANPAAVLEMVSMIRERDAAMRRVLDLLGPDVPECSGCAAEWRMAIDEIKECINA